MKHIIASEDRRMNDFRRFNAKLERKSESKMGKTNEKRENENKRIFESKYFVTLLRA